ncbi:hypothetical protein [Methylosinus sp. Ce-a6]|uniref:hypothetical protein n=1 Tax=Methylosinus sp. Ce-a6 TaxID=2172005 RepID=UPI00135CEF89|nr:hypothetical protein [Methylosinus sp. Ce-a6]
MAYTNDAMIEPRPRAKTKPTTTKIIIDVRPTRDVLPKRPAARTASKPSFDGKAFGHEQRERIERIQARNEALRGRK